MSFNSSSDSSDNRRDERAHWNRKYRDSPSHWLEPDPFLAWAFSKYVAPAFPRAGRALDLAGGAGRHAIWLAKQGWEVMLIDISDAGVELARQNAGPLASHIQFAVDDLTEFKASQTGLEAKPEGESKAESERKPERKFEGKFEVVMAFFYLERPIFPEIVKALRPGGLLIYKTHTVAQAALADGPKNPEHLLQPDELLHLASGLRVLHYRERLAEKATAELVARKEA